MTLSKSLPVCPQCMREGSDGVSTIVQECHRASREAFSLPVEPPADPGGVRCTVCVNRCSIPVDARGYCGLRRNEGGSIRTLAGTADSGALQWYYDALPTNCVADWVCPGGSAAGYPRYSFSAGPERGYKNLAVFYEACSYNCLFCQNWHFRQHVVGSRKTTAQELADVVDDRTACICYFGGDPTPQVFHALEASRIAVDAARQPLRICWETNGSTNLSFMKKMVSLSLETGGCIKFDLKAFDERLHRALTGTSNEWTLRNFRCAAALVDERPEPPLLIASTLLVPGYIDADEVGAIARFMAGLNRDIPYALLAFYPQFCFQDLPTTSRAQAERCIEAAERAGLTRVRVGNLHLLS